MKYYLDDDKTGFVLGNYQIRCKKEKDADDQLLRDIFDSLPGYPNVWGESCTIYFNTESDRLAFLLRWQ